MAVPGLQKLNISQNTGTTRSSGLKQVVAKNISNAKQATGAMSFGIQAQRSSVGTGAIFNPKAFYGPSIAAQRAALNSNRTRVYNNFGDYAYSNVGNNNGMNKFAAGLLAVSALADVSAQIITAAKSPKTTSGTNSIEGAGGKDKTSTTSSSTKSLGEMKSAKDSSTLRGAIETAKSDKSGMEAELKTLESKLPEMKEASEAATKQLEELTPKVEAKEKEVKLKEADVKAKEGDVNEKKSSLKVAENRLSSCDTAFKEACTQYRNAETGLDRAKGNLASAEANIDPDTNKPVEPAYTNAKNAVKQAEEELKQAENAKQEAAGSLEQAKADNNTAKQVYFNAQDALKEANTELDNSKRELEQLKEELAPLKQQQSDAQKQVDAYDNAVKQQTELKSNIASLEKEIPAQEKRLTELESKEAKGLKGAENTILQMADKLAGKDGISGTDDDKKKLSSKDQEKLDNAKNLQRNVNYTKLYQTDGETINGKTFRKAEYNGETLYMIGSKKVDERTYNFQYNVANDQTKINNELDPFRKNNIS